MGTWQFEFRGITMEWQQWVPAVVSLVGGGAAGAVITVFVTRHRNRVQPVGFRAEPLPMFRGVTDGRGVKLKVSLESDGQLHDFPNLHAVDVEIVNRGNVDKPTFGFGLTLEPSVEAVFVEVTPVDRHHVFTALPKVSPTEPSAELDFEVKPFNRGDRYRFTAYAIVPSGKESVGAITFSSSESVVFTPMPTAGEIGMKIAKVAASQALSIPLGGVRIEFEKKPPWS